MSTKDHKVNITIHGKDVDASKTMDQVADNYEKNVSKIEQSATKLAVAGGIITAALGAAAKANMNLNAEMANVATLIPGNVKRIEELKRSVQSLAVETGKSTSDLSNGLYQIVSAFGDSAESAEKLEINAKAAAAGLATTLEAINLTSAVTKGYGDVSAAATQRVADLAFLTVKLGQTTFPELAASIGRVVPLAASLKVSQDELFAGFATLTGVTGNAAEVSTQYAAILRAMLNQTEQMTLAIRALGYETAEEMLKTEGLTGALRKLIATTDGTQESVAALFGRAEALTAVFALTGAQAETFDRKLKEIQRSVGATDEAFKEQTEGINKQGFALEQLKQKWSLFVQTIGEKLIPVVETVTNTLDRLIGILQNDMFATFIAKAGLAAGTVLTLAGALGLLIKALPTIKLGFAALTGPVGLAVTGLVALAAVINNVYHATENATNALDKQAEKLEELHKDASALVEEYETLAAKTKLTADEKKRLKELTEQLTQILPRAVEGYDTERQAIINLNKAYQELNALKEREVKTREKKLSMLYLERKSDYMAIQTEIALMEERVSKYIEKANDPNATELERTSAVSILGSGDPDDPDNKAGLMGILARLKQREENLYRDMQIYLTTLRTLGYTLEEPKTSGETASTTTTTPPPSGGEKDVVKYDPQKVEEELADTILKFEEELDAALTELADAIEWRAQNWQMYSEKEEKPDYDLRLTADYQRDVEKYEVLVEQAMQEITDILDYRAEQLSKKYRKEEEPDYDLRMGDEYQWNIARYEALFDEALQEVNDVVDYNVEQIGIEADKFVAALKLHGEILEDISDNFLRQLNSRFVLGSGISAAASVMESGGDPALAALAAIGEFVMQTNVITYLFKELNERGGVLIENLGNGLIPIVTVIVTLLRILDPILKGITWVTEQFAKIVIWVMNGIVKAWNATFGKIFGEWEEFNFDEMTKVNEAYVRAQQNVVKGLRLEAMRFEAQSPQSRSSYEQAKNMAESMRPIYVTINATMKDGLLEDSPALRRQIRDIVKSEERIEAIRNYGLITQPA